MQFTLRGEPVVFEPLPSVVAVRPSAELRATYSRGEILERLGTAPARHDVAAPISFTARRLFENAGWIFAEATPLLAEAARAPVGRRDEHTALPIFFDPGRNTRLGTGRVVVKLPDDLTRAQARAQMREDGLTEVERLTFGTNLFEARVRDGQPLDEAIAELQERPWYVFAEPVFLQVLRGRLAGPDPELARQWQHDNDGSGLHKKGCDIKTPGAWKTGRGAGIRIAIIDNGMQVDHPDLAVVSGGYFVTDPDGKAHFQAYVPGQAFPDDPHGTFCMGMAGARMNNSVGGCGSAPEAELMAIACEPDQVGTQLTLAKSVAFAADPSRTGSGLTAAQGADVLSCSLAAENEEWTMDSSLALAITEAATEGRGGRGMPIFWAVANARTSLALDQVCSLPHVIAVGASGPRDIRGTCAFGPKLDFLAPGVEVFSTRSGGKFDTATGTSFACPLAAGVGALVLARFPHWTPDQVRKRLHDTCDKIGGPTVAYSQGRNDDYGYGRINADRAVNDPYP